MLISFLRWLTFFASLSFLLIYFKGGTSVLKDAKRTLEHAAGQSYIIAASLMAFLALTILLTQLLVCLRTVQGVPRAGQEWMVSLGTLLAVAGIAGTFWIRYRYLGRFWSGSLEIQEGHAVVDQGPYRAVRHPLYAVTLVIYLGVALTFGVWWNWIACGLMIVGYIWLIAHEDRFLAASLPGYQEYQQRTRYRVVPGIW